MRRPRRGSGTVLVELAFCLPIMCAILLVIMDYGYMMYVLISMQSATRQGLWAGIHDTVWTSSQIGDITFHADQGKSFARSDVSVFLNSTDPSFGTTLPTCEVQINHTHRFLVPFLLPKLRLADSNVIVLRARAKGIVVPGLKLR
jgi:Flp pilus assembly protein TadG